MDSARLLDDLRDRLGDPPRRINIFRRLALRVSPPAWMRDDPLREVYRNQGRILSNGEVLWASIVQANQLLFEPGPRDHPAMVLYSHDPAFEDRVDLLRSLGERLYSLKGTTPADPQQRRLAEMITGEMERGIGWTIPKSLAWGREVKSSSVMIIRRHLPVPYLVNGWFPLLVEPESGLVMVVPSVFWPSGLVAAWRG